MAESQNVEYKESWRNEYLKWICGFANAQGGTIYIGMDDHGKVVGIPNAKKLLEDLPNTIRDTMGIMVDVNRLTEGPLEYIEIVVPSSSYPVNYHGEYHYRSGSTKQQLHGAALTEFLMRKTGMRWEDVTVDDVSVEDLDEESFRIFRREALRSKRMTEQELNLSREELLRKLHLMSGDKLKRSAVLLFHSDPQVVQTGSYVKIGKFSGSELLYQHTLEGSLINTADKVVDLIYLMYLKAKITYDKEHRVETYPYAREAVREAIFNAIIHNCYMYGTPIQIRINDGESEMIISNSCMLPEGWTAETFMKSHESKPYNPDMANVFYRAGYIENWGRGIQKICDECDALGAERPRYEILGHGIRVFFKGLESALFVEPASPNKQDVGLERLDDTVGSPLGTLEMRNGTLESQVGTLDGTLGLSDDTLAASLIALIRDNPRITQTEVVEKLHVSIRTVKRIVGRLSEKGIIIRKGGKRYGYWEVL